MSKTISIDKIIDFAAGRLGKEASLALLDQIEHDEQASKDLDMITTTMELLEKEGDALSAKRIEQPVALVSRLGRIFSPLLPKFRAHPVLSGAAAFAFVFAALMIMLPPSSPYGSLASLRDFDFAATIRGVELEDFEVAFDLYRKGEYEESIKLFERYIRAFPRSTLVDYAHYSAGAAYLRWSESRFYSFFIGFDRNRVQNGLNHLQEVVHTTGNGRLLEDTRWLLAKGNLMLSDEGPALDELRAIVQMGGPRREDATEMIRSLNKVEQNR